MPVAVDIKALAFDPVGRFDALPDAVVDRLITAVSRSYAPAFGGEVERSDLVAYHVAHLLALSGVGTGGQGGGVGPVASHSVSLGGASVTYAVATVQAGATVQALDGRTVYGVIALGIRDGVPTVATGYA